MLKSNNVLENGVDLTPVQPGVKTASFTTADIDLSGVDYIALDVTVSAIAGTTPSYTPYFQRKKSDGTYVTIWTGTAITANGDMPPMTLGRGFAYLAGTNLPQALGATGRFGMTVTGTTPSASIALSVLGGVCP